MEPARGNSPEEVLQTLATLPPSSQQVALFEQRSKLQKVNSKIGAKRAYECLSFSSFSTKLRIRRHIRRFKTLRDPFLFTYSLEPPDLFFGFLTFSTCFDDFLTVLTVRKGHEATARSENHLGADGRISKKDIVENGNQQRGLLIPARSAFFFHYLHFYQESLNTRKSLE